MPITGNVNGPFPDSEVEYITMKASAARAKGDPVTIDLGSGGFVDLSLADTTDVKRLAVATKTMATGDSGLYVVKGPCTITVPSGTYTADHGLKILDGAIADTGSAFPSTGVLGEAQTSFGCVRTTGTSVTSIDVFLHGFTFTSTT